MLKIKLSQRKAAWGILKNLQNSSNEDNDNDDDNKQGEDGDFIKTMTFDNVCIF